MARDTQTRKQAGYKTCKQAGYPLSYLVGGPLHRKTETIPLTYDWVMLGEKSDLLYRSAGFSTTIRGKTHRVFIYQEVDDA